MVSQRYTGVGYFFPALPTVSVEVLVLRGGPDLLARLFKGAEGRSLGGFEE